ncbi:Lar family restriction alleviation protein [Sphingomonas sanxanigenens]|uniref:Lar family restriction alleviation protein n=1 Tax=Sphingomonas sanxanigenens TaxID=397260 RepID=UPI0013012622|nr:Lar family restriction alleviation protein [Sphingomonas sanxanigenens]
MSETEALRAALEPCPLCGQPGTLGRVQAGIEWWQVECEAERGDGCGLVIQRSTPEAAIAAWNRRTIPAPDQSAKACRDIATAIRRPDDE